MTINGLHSLSPGLFLSLLFLALLFRVYQRILFSNSLISMHFALVFLSPYLPLFLYSFVVVIIFARERRLIFCLHLIPEF